jgi:predicted lipid-binding transport protein (Tim44 family)
MFNGLVDIIIFAGIAIFLVFRLLNVLGRTDSNDIKNRKKLEEVYDNMMKDEKKAEIIEHVLQKNANEQKEIKKKYGDLNYKNLEEIKKQDSNFTIESFLSGAEKAFEIILSSYAAGKIDPLKSLLEISTFRDFVKSIEKREEKQQTQQTTLISVDLIDIDQIKVKRNLAEISVKIHSQQINSILDKNGKS